MGNVIDETEKLIQGITIPPAPEILKQLHQQLQVDNPSLIAISNIIAEDVGMSALVLRTVNSAMYGLRQKVKSINHAASLLGINNTVNIVAGLALKKTFEESDGANPPNYWDSPANIALVAAAIAEKLPGVDKDEAYMLGLFHNVGHALMMRRFPDYRDFLNEALVSDMKITVAEEEVYQTNHAIVGYFLAKSWELEDYVADLILHHHDVDTKLRMGTVEEERQGMLLAALKMAEHIDKEFWGYLPDVEWDSIEEQILDFTGMSKPDFDDLSADLGEQLISA